MRRVAAAVVVGEGWRQGGEQKTDASFWNICSRTNSGLSPPLLLCLVAAMARPSAKQI